MYSLAHTHTRTHAKHLTGLFGEEGCFGFTMPKCFGARKTTAKPKKRNPKSLDNRNVGENWAVGKCGGK